MKATIKLISSVWTLEFEMVSEGEIKILRYSRDDPEGYEKEDQFPRLMIDEDAQRTVWGVYLMPFDPFKCWANISESVYFKVVNPAHIFSYGS
ncbi:hypothetical protein GCM10007423_63380 [Dyadobacter endophyticus]|uniref:Uncharacterized protein n=1 Tax=Dyadobacter endophyticus TaxID=1749036 RepID=A0ABQ1ZCY4_9BACT|nr:hypothetical protein [Dyadobacter endophyticus]GGH55637.1 hypothetical protein GCM10007423_63380 [Dyadobacter endophyticus]